MARKKKHPEHVNHERWLVSYADFITLLFAFFVVMFAVSQVDSKKVGRFTESFSKAIGIDMFPQAGRGLLAGASQGTFDEPSPSQASPLPEELVNLKAALTTPSPGEEGLQNVQVLQRRNELVLRLSEGFLFESGNDALQERARRVIGKLANELRSRPVDIRVEGHTDDRPIHTARFRSNWDLSTGRATAVVARLAAEGIEPPRLSAAGYGEFHPLASNATDEGRKQNRRVDLVISLPVNMKETPAEATASTKGADAGAATAPSDSADHDSTGHDKAGDGKADHDSTGHDKAGDGKADHGKADHGKDDDDDTDTDHDSADHDSTGHDKPAHSKEHP